MMPFTEVSLPVYPGASMVLLLFLEDQSDQAEAERERRDQRDDGVGRHPGTQDVVDRVHTSSVVPLYKIGAGERSRTSTTLRSLAPEANASASSATPACYFFLGNFRSAKSRSTGAIRCRSAGVIFSMKSSPSMWSISCWTAWAASPAKTSSIGPSGVHPTSLARVHLGMFARIPGKDRHPSIIGTRSPDVCTSGFQTTRWT